MTDTSSADPLERTFFTRGQPRESSTIMNPDAPAGAYPPDSSEWWLRRLLGAMATRNVRLADLRSYYEGTNSTWSLADRAHRDTFGGRFKDLRANLAKPVVEVPEQRMTVTGMTIEDDDEGSERAWDIWQQNSLEDLSSEAHLSLLSTGLCPVMVDPWREVAPGIPLITVEDPLGVIVEHMPWDRRERVAALKRWTDDSGHRLAILYLSDRIEWWRTTSRDGSDRPPSWVRLEGSGYGGPNRLGVVPVVELRNAPRAQAEHEGIIDQLKLIATALYRMATAAHYTSYRQKWASGIEDDEEDVELDADGNPLASRPASAASGPDTLVSTAAPDARFGTFEQSDMEPFIREIDMHQGMVATISHTPHRLILPPPTSVPPSGESVRLEDLPLTQKIARKFRSVGSGWETVMRLAFLAAGDQLRARRMDMRTEWRDPEPHTMSELMDALVKAVSLGIPQEELWRRYGATPSQIRRWRARPAQATPDHHNVPPGPVTRPTPDVPA